jgi:hypothetical protein
VFRCGVNSGTDSSANISTGIKRGTFSPLSLWERATTPYSRR